MRNNIQALLLLHASKRSYVLYNILAIISARSGSKRVPDKNIKMLGGFPLIQWSIKACKRSKIINQFSLFKIANIFLDNGFASKPIQDIATNKSHEYELLTGSDIFRQMYILVGEKN